MSKKKVPQSVAAVTSTPTEDAPASEKQARRATWKDSRWLLGNAKTATLEEHAADAERKLLDALETAHGIGLPLPEGCDCRNCNSLPDMSGLLTDSLMSALRSVHAIVSAEEDGDAEGEEGEEDGDAEEVDEGEETGQLTSALGLLKGTREHLTRAIGAATLAIGEAGGEVPVEAHVERHVREMREAAWLVSTTIEAAINEIKAGNGMPGSPAGNRPPGGAS